jgi:hypothetical protein
VTPAPDQTPPGGRAPVLGDGPVVKAAAYLALSLLGAVQALIGTFQFGRGPGVLVPICFALAILATCLLGSWGMRSAVGGVLPAAGWFLVSVVLGSSSAGGSVLVTDTAQGQWFLFGGAICAAAGALLAFARWSRASMARRSGPNPPIRPRPAPSGQPRRQANGSQPRSGRPPR